MKKQSLLLGAALLVCSVMAYAIAPMTTMKNQRGTLENQRSSGLVGLNHQTKKEKKLPLFAKSAKKAGAKKIDAKENLADEIVLYGLATNDGTYYQYSTHKDRVYSFHPREVFDFIDESKREILCGNSAAYAGDKYYVIGAVGEAMTLATYNSKTWELINGPDSVAPYDGDTMPRNCGTYNPGDGMLYFCAWGNMAEGTYTTTKPIMRLNPNTLEVSKVLDSFKFINMMFIGPDGELYAVSYDSANIFKINIAEGKMDDMGTLKGLSGGNLFFAGLGNSAYTDPVSGVTYAVIARSQANSDPGIPYLYSFDVRAGAGNITATQIMQLPDNTRFQGLYIPDVIADAPGAASGISYDQAGKINFTAPTKTYNTNADLTGTLTAVINIVGVGTRYSDTKTVEVAPGESKSVDCTLDDGEYVLSIVVKNAAGDGPVRKASFVAGDDLPAGVNGLTQTVTGSNVSLKWTKPTKSLKGGYVNDAEIRYTIIRYPDETVIADNIEATNFDDVLPDAIGYYYYEVVSMYRGRSGGNALTQQFSYGDRLYPPFIEQYEFYEDFDRYTVFDLNNDGRTFDYFPTYYGSYVVMYGNGLADPETGFVPTANDDMFFSPKMALKKGVTYRMFMPLEAPSVPESFHLYIAKEVSPTAQMQKVADIYFSWDKEYYMDELFSVAEDGDYHFVMHSDQKGNSAGFYVDNLMVLIHGTDGAPAMVDNLKATAGAKGAIANTVSFNAPRKTYDGKTLSSITKICIFKGSDVKHPVYTFENPAPGESLTWDDPNPEYGSQFYTITTYNEVGVGGTAYIENWVGLDIPIMPQNFYAKQIVEDGAFKPSFTWDAVPAVGAHGGYVDLDDVTYHIAYGYVDVMQQWDYVVKTQDTKAVADYDYPGYQDIATYRIEARNAAGTSDCSYFDIILGEPYPQPWKESFPEAYAETEPWTIYSDTYYYAWEVISGDGLSVKPMDADGGMAKFSFNYNTDASLQRLQGPRISLKNSTNPELSFYMYHGNEAEEEDLELYVYTNTNDEGWKKVATLAYNNGTKGWQRHSVALTAGATDVQIGFMGYAADASAPIFIDNFVVDNSVAYDLSLQDFQISKRIERNTVAKAVVKVTNLGFETADNYTVNLLRDGKVFASQNCQDLKQNEQKAVEFNVRGLVNEGAEQFVFSANVEYAKDLNPANNESVEKTVFVTGSLNPAPTNLVGVEESGTVTLTWDAPATDEVIDPVTDDFEAYEDFIIDEIGDWITYDGDGTQPVYFGGPAIPNVFEPQAWQVYNPVQAGFDTNRFTMLTPHSGNKYLACFAASDGVQYILENDDWLISSDVLPGSEISFWMRNPIAGSAPQIWEMMYTNDDPEDPETYVAFDRDQLDGTDAWVEFHYTVPKDAKCFAIRCCSEAYKNRTVLFLDDLTYTPLYGATTKLKLNGYNIYRDGKLIGTSQTTTFTDVIAPNHWYVVTANWEEGESLSTNQYVYGDITGVNRVNASNVDIRGGKQVINISGANGMTQVFTIDGRLVYSSKVSGNASVKVGSGMYIVRTDGAIAKVNVY